MQPKVASQKPRWVFHSTLIISRMATLYQIRSGGSRGPVGVEPTRPGSQPGRLPLHHGPSRVPKTRTRTGRVGAVHATITPVPYEVGSEGVEPSRPCGQRFLRPPRLPRFQPRAVEVERLTTGGD